MKCNKPGCGATTFCPDCDPFGVCGPVSSKPYGSVVMKADNSRTGVEIYEPYWSVHHYKLPCGCYCSEGEVLGESFATYGSTYESARNLWIARRNKTIRRNQQ